MFLVEFVCLFVCLTINPSDYLKSDERRCVSGQGKIDEILGMIQIKIRDPECMDLHENFTRVVCRAKDQSIISDYDPD